MNDTPTPLSRFDELGRRAFWLLGQVALWGLVWLCLMKFPNAPAADLDPSWRMTLGYAEIHNFQFGTELIFTYGPLGYLLPPVNLGEHYYHHIIWQLVANGVFALAIYLLGREFRGWRKFAYYFFLLGFASGYIDVIHIIAVLLLGLALAREGIVRRRWLVGLLVVGLAILSLVKFTNFLLALFSVLSLSALYAYRRRWPEVMLIGGGFIVAFLGGWAACGQHLGNIPAYLANSLNASNGYAEGMGLPGPDSTLALGLGSLAAIGAYYALVLWRAPDQPRAIAVVAIAAAASYLNWKHGFVRADGHVLAHFFLCLLIVVSSPALLQDDGPFRRTKGLLLVVAAILSLAGTWANASFTVTDALAAINLHVKESVMKIGQFGQLTQLAREEFATVSQANSMPAARTVIGDKPMDVVGSEQAYAFFNGLNYRPRPVFQSYFPYTEHLARLNEDFMKSSRAPEFVLQKVQTLDFRLPGLDDSLTTRYLFHHYTLLMEEHGFLVWRRNPPDPSLDVKTLLSARPLHFGEVVSVPDLGDVPIWCEIDVRPSLLGRLRSFLFRPPFVQMAAKEGGNTVTNYRLVSGMARAGFLLYPYFASNHHIQRYEEGNPNTRITSFSLEMEASQRKYFQADIGLKLYQLPRIPQSQHGQTQAPEIRYRVFSQVPTAVNAMFPADILLEGDKEVLLAHPTSAIEFTLTSQTHRATGKFGMVANAYTHGNTTDGAEFIVDWVTANGDSTRLFYRLLRPLSAPSDRGMQSFDIPVPPGGGRLILRTTPGPAGDVSFDWTYWTDVKFTP